MSDWRGYQIHPDACPERPWWIIFRSREVAERSDGARTAVVPGFTIEHRIALADRENPLPAPERKCGQVWVAVGAPVRSEGMVVGVLDMGAGPVVKFGSMMWTGVGWSIETSEWPPSGAVCVAGPGSPWAPADSPLTPK